MKAPVLDEGTQWCVSEDLVHFQKNTNYIRSKSIRRKAREGQFYTCSEFNRWYGNLTGNKIWQEASAEHRLAKILADGWSLDEKRAEAVSKRSIPIQEITHPDLAAIRDETLLTFQADDQWATDVEWQLQHSHATSKEISQAGDMVAEEVFLLRLGSGDTQTFRKQLLEGTQFQRFREALHEARHVVEQPSGALVFVKPEQFRDVMCALKGIELHPFHIITRYHRVF